MDIKVLLDAVILGMIEGVTEFLPISSTAHMLLANHFFGFKSQNGVFEVVIQFGAILAVVFLYFARLRRVALALPTQAEARYFVLTILIAFLPSVVLGVLLHDFIKQVLFASPRLISWSLILGGVVILAVERLPKRDTVTDAEKLPVCRALGIGLFQCLAMIPGVSRSGATIIGGMLLGVSRKAAAEFSFFLSIPTMFAAAAYDLYKNLAVLESHDFALIATGFTVAFVAAMLVVRYFIVFITRYGLVPFAWYRIILGSVVLMALASGA